MIIRSVSHSTGARSSVSGPLDGRHGPQAVLEERHERPDVGRRGLDPLGQLLAGGLRVEAEHELVEAQRPPAPGLRELRQEGAADRLRQPLVARHARDVERDDPARPEVFLHGREELPGRQVEGDVGLVVGVDDDDVVRLVGQLEERPPVVGDDVQPRVVVQAEVPARGIAHLRVDLDAVDLDVRIQLAVCARHRPARVPDDEHRSTGRSSSGGTSRKVSQTPPVSTESSCQTEWTATPSFSLSAREPSSRSTIWMYW